MISISLGPVTTLVFLGVWFCGLSLIAAEPPYIALAHDSNKAPVTALAWAPDKQEVIVGSTSGLQVYQYPAMSVLRQLSTCCSWVHALAFSRDETRLWVGGGVPGTEGMIEQFEWPSGKRVYERKIYEDVVYALTVTEEGDEFIAATDVDIGVGQVKSDALSWLKGHSQRVLSLGYLAQEDCLVSGSSDQTLRVWDLSERKSLRVLQQPTGAIHAIAVKPRQSDSEKVQIATAGEDRTIRFWQPTIGRMLKYAKVESTPLCLAWDASGEQIYVGCEDGYVRTLEVGELIWSGRDRISDHPVYAILAR